MAQKAAQCGIKSVGRRRGGALDFVIMCPGIGVYVEQVKDE